jgi:hypothetical protein
MTAIRNHWRVLGVAASALALLAVTAAQESASAAPAAPAAAAQPVVKLSSSPLGMNIPPWDALYANTGSGNILQKFLKNADVTQLHYGGGQYSDEFDWQTDSSIQNCKTTALSQYTAKCAIYNALYFTLFSKKARAIGAQSFVTVNYGSGTPSEAAAEVKQSKKAGDQVAEWEIGNEGYGCWEDNNWLADAPEDYQGYNPKATLVDGNNPTCPMIKEGSVDAGMAIMAKSYAANAAKFMAAMKAVNPGADIGVPYAFDSSVGGASVAGSTVWNNTVLSADRKYIGFVDLHWYPESYGGTTGADGNPTAQQVIQSVYQIPAEYAKVKAELKANGLSGAKMVVGETGVSYLATNTACKAVGALFAAGDALEWLSQGASTVDWWQLSGYGNTGTTCTKADEGMFTSNNKPVQESPYVGYMLAGSLAKPGAKLTTLALTPAADSSSVLAFQSVLPTGKADVLLINTSTSTQAAVTFRSSLAGKLTKVLYAGGNQNSFGTKTTTSATTSAAVAKGIVLPAESITLLKNVS